ncbi:MAG: hypothetical protein WBL84_22050, partial [Xanthobacteraceae bacterium]
RIGRNNPQPFLVGENLFAHGVPAHTLASAGAANGFPRAQKARSLINSITRLQALHEAVFSNIIRNQHKNER